MEANRHPSMGSTQRSAECLHFDLLGMFRLRQGDQPVAGFETTAAQGISAQDKPDVLQVRILAPTALRVKRLAEPEHISQAEAQKRIRERDLSDFDWIMHYFGLDNHDPSRFDIILNKAKYTPAITSDLIVQALSVLPKKK